MLTQYNLKMPHAVYGGENAMDNITAIIKARGAKKVAMFTDKGIEGAGLFALPEEAVKASGAEYYVLDELPPEPSYMAVQKLVDEFKTSGADLIVACGGGSVMDAAKLASVLVTDDYGVKELLDNPGMAQKCVPIVLIPTTAGTSADVSQFVIISNQAERMKFSIVSKAVVPDVALIDPETTASMDPFLSACTGIDALVHAIEAFVSTGSGPLTDPHALEAMRLIGGNLAAMIANPADIERYQIEFYNLARSVKKAAQTDVQRGSAILHGEMDAFENAGRQPASVYRDAVLYTTLSPCAMCSGTILLYGIPRVIVGENRTFLGEEALLRSRGVQVEVRQDAECIALMEEFIARRPELWNEDIGVDPAGHA